MVSQSQSGILIASYTYYSQNRMTAADAYGIFGTLTETYSYDALGNRIAKTTDGGGSVRFLTDSTGAVTDSAAYLFAR